VTVPHDSLYMPMCFSPWAYIFIVRTIYLHVYIDEMDEEFFTYRYTQSLTTCMLVQMQWEPREVQVLVDHPAPPVVRKHDADLLFSEDTKDFEPGELIGARCVCLYPTHQVHT